MAILKKFVPQPLFMQSQLSVLSSYVRQSYYTVQKKCNVVVVVVVVLLFYVHGKHLRSCLDGQLT